MFDWQKDEGCAASVSCARNGFDFEQEFFLDQAIDHANGVRWEDWALEVLGEMFGTQGHELFDVLRMHKVGGEFRNMIERHAHGLEHHAHVVEHSQELCLKVVFAYDLSVIPDGELARNEVDVAS